MKVLISFFVLFSTMTVLAEENVHFTAQTVQESCSLDKSFDRKRREKRINKKRKRKCHQFARRSYAG